jgi:ABC-2 type transport system ATP-binding protein
MNAPLIEIDRLTHRYGERVALDSLTLAIEPGECFAILGPNGGGKTTLFRVLSTLLRPQQGTLRIAGQDLVEHAREIRTRLGIVFQAPSLDKKLSVAENIWCQGRLYGLSSSTIKTRAAALLARLGIAERANDRVETLSGGLKRRVEIAKALLHEPAILLLDEPSTGLDPLARRELWTQVRELQNTAGITVVFTTHFLDEADRADRVAILDAGKLVALDKPTVLRGEIAGESLTIETGEPTELAAAITERFQLPVRVIDAAVRIEAADAHRWVERLVEAFPDRIDGMHLGKSTLEDVFIARTGKGFYTAAPAVPDKAKRRPHKSGTA